MGRLLLVALIVSCHVPAWAQSAAGTPPQPAQAYFEFMLARRLESQGDTKAALDALQRARALDPGSAEVLAEIAAFHARQNNGPDAVEAAERALAIDADNLEARRILGLVYAAWSESAGRAPGGRTPGELRTLAIDHLTAILGSPSIATDLNLQLTLARLQLRAGRADRAVPILENIVAQVAVAEPYALLAEARLGLGRTEEAIDALEQAASLNPRHLPGLAALYERNGRWADAAAAYDEAMKRARTVSRDLRLRWATALLNVPGRDAAARVREGLEAFLETSPHDGRALYLLSSAHLRLADIEGAETIARRLLALDGGNLQGLRALANALSARRDFDGVVALLTPLAADVKAMAKGREGEAAVLLAQLAYAHSERGEHDRAVSVLTAAVASDPLSATALNSLGYTLADRGERLDEAVAFIQRALQIEPGNPAYLDSLGWALFKQGRAAEAEAHLRKAADALPTQSVVQEHLGDVLAEQGKFADAVGAWERALAGDGVDIDRAAVEKKIKDARGRQQ